MSGLVHALRAIADHALEALTDDRARDAVASIRRRLDEPLRVAVAGRVSAGKSTLVNALLSQRVVPVGAGECTQVVTWLRYGEVDEAAANREKHGQKKELRDAEEAREQLRNRLLDANKMDDA